MKNFLMMKIFSVNSKIRVYVYTITLFLIICLVSFIFVMHQNRVFINTKINQKSFIYKKPLKLDLDIGTGTINEQLDEFKGKIKDINIIVNNSENDNLITKYVNNKISFNNLSYIPQDLVRFSSGYVIDLKGNSLLRVEANSAFEKLAKDFYDTFGEKVEVVSGYRSYQYQVLIKKGGCSDMFCAKAGFSEHQTGLAVDLWEASSKNEFLSNSNFVKYFKWMQGSAYKYGFHNTYQKGIEVDGYVVEPWHWRYLGLELAKKLYDTNMTLAEYHKNLK